MESVEGIEEHSGNLTRRGAVVAAGLGVSAVLLRAVGRAQDRIASEQSAADSARYATHPASVVDHAAAAPVVHAASAAVVHAASVDRRA